MGITLHRRALLTIIVFAAVPGRATPPASAADQRAVRQRACKRLAAKMRRLESRLRVAHSNKAGRSYREKLRALQLERYRRCR